ncbi:uncharacterized protein NESG_01488 [Nematocida ausubeli]|uniref:Uncharacterized protein n=1 Tax=Nematocida ausubeli (strain ATCC PRA-371 / ERTm2) TaxID=1913371 RepID=A0A086J2J9_NEMA1|nr:uncharacterized protein NESG_01488 [Nematocida ausubeli]KFG26367.1 hypothetical protein NESG_01488 [Nematocida ausubeli]
MDICENNEVIELSQYYHNDKVIALSEYGKILFTATKHHLYAWDDKEISLLAVFRVPTAENSSEKYQLEGLLANKNDHRHDLDRFKLFMLEEERPPLYIFLPKGYYIINRLTISVHLQKRFIPYCHTKNGSFAVEEDNTLYFYGKKKIPLLKLPADDICTKLKCIGEELYAATEKGHILKISIHSAEDKAVEIPMCAPCTNKVIFNLEDHIVTSTLAFAGAECPILDFHLHPIIIAYFGRRLYSPLIECKEKEQILNFYCMHSLFIVFTPAGVLLLNESLHRLNRSRVHGEAISHMDRIFISQEVGTLNEIRISSL